MQITNVIKRNGEAVAFDPSRLTKWAEWASNEGVDWFSIVSEAYKRCPNKCTTKDLHYAMIAACLDKETTPYLRMAGRLLVGDVYKQAFGGHENIPSLNEFYHKMVGLGYYENMGYSEDEITYLDCHIKHDLDKQMIYSEIKQYLDKYCISDKVNSRAIESPQFAIMRVAMGVMQYEKEKRLESVVALYNMLSQKKINAPTPYMVNLGTPKRGLASCCVYTTADNIPSITVGDHIAYMMTCNSAGIGAHMQTRSKGDGVRNNTIKHLGKLPYYKMVESSVSANLQNGRGGAATMYFTVLDPEIMDLIALKTPTTVADKQIRKIDYAVSYNKRFLDAVRNNEEWMLISYKNAPDLYDAMYLKEQDTFNSLYEQYKENILVRKTFVKARDLMFAIVHHRVSTGRLYLFRPDIANKHTPFKEKIYSSNLCLEVTLPTAPFTGVQDLYSEESEGEIALCSLAAIVVSNVKDYEYEQVAYYALKMVDNVIEMMDYPFKSLARTAKARRSAGVGITGLAHYLAKNGEWYSSKSGKTMMHRLAERHMYSLILASATLAKERGKCEWYDKTLWNDGWMPIDTASESVDDVCDSSLMLNWDWLRGYVKQHGMRNSVVVAHMPCESSSLASNSTNGLYPIRESVVIKTNASSKNVFIAPESDMLYYESAWDASTKDMLEMYGIFQKFTDQAISADTYLVIGNDRKVSGKEMIDNILYADKMGLKGEYYLNSQTTVKDVCEGCSI